MREMKLLIYLAEKTVYFFCPCLLNMPAGRDASRIPINTHFISAVLPGSFLLLGFFLSESLSDSRSDHLKLWVSGVADE